MEVSDRILSSEHQQSPALASVSSPIPSVSSRGYSTRSTGSISSIASSPAPRESFDLYGSKLGKVTEEPQEQTELEGYTLVDNAPHSVDDYEKCFSTGVDPIEPPDASEPGFRLSSDDIWDTAFSGYPHFKRQKSLEHVPTAAPHRFSSRFHSISRRWRNRSGAGQQLSMVSHTSLPCSRTNSVSSTQVISPALSAISKYESYLPTSPVHLSLDETLYDLEVEPISISSRRPSEGEADEDGEQATTPLLPPIFTQLAKKDSPIQSPLQSPSIAATPTITSTRTSFDAKPGSILPSPPLSTRPSVASIHQNSQGGARILNELPPMPLLDDLNDPWAVQLGHANFHIHPEPYVPESNDLASYTEFRANWDQARTNYVKHLARTIEHYGSTSKVYKLTEEKWKTVDDLWKQHNDVLTSALAPLFDHSMDVDTEKQDVLQSSVLLEKPATRIVIPAIDDKSGKFPELGDGEIVGPMAVGPPRSISYQKRPSDPATPPHSPRKKQLFKFLSEVFGRN